jgi:hypothetical protein
MRFAGLLMMAIGVVLVVATAGVALAMGWGAFLAQGTAMVALYGLLLVMGVALVLVGRRTAFPRP